MKTNILDYLDEGGLNLNPDGVWLKDGILEWSFSQFADRASSIGSALLMRGVGVGEVVAVFIPNSAHVLAADFGVARAGCAFMNIDVSLPAPRVRAILDSVEPRLIIVSKALYDTIPWVHQVKTVVYEDLLDTEISAKDLYKRQAAVIDTDPACLITTSGSTGVPKAVALSHRGLIDFGEWFDSRFEFNGNDVVGSLSPLFFDGYIPGLFMSLLHGGKFVILPRETAAFPVKLVEQLAINEVSFIFWVPSTLVPIAKLKVLDNFPLPRLRFVGFAGEVMQPTALSYLRKVLPKAVFVNFYGPIEISVICTYFVVPLDFPSDKPVPIGLPCYNTRILILDENDALCKPGQPGELCVAGGCLALGYWNNPEKTSIAFVTNPLIRSYEQKIYRTGDIATMEDDGTIYFVGRKDFQIKHQGYRIDLGEIEHAADVTLEAKSCCVIYNSETRNIVLFYEGDIELNAQDIRTRMGVQLPKYMLPTKITRLEKMPLNPNGKIDRKLLSTTFLEITQKLS
jgi:acyl-CoA synthetase (AMP-forming)/AMP-acid ligase II